MSTSCGNEYRYYAKNGESFVTNVALLHDGVAPVFSAEKLENINKRVQSGQASLTTAKSAVNSR